MVVNSLSFLLFFTVVFLVYYLPVCRKSPKFQNLWLFIASYFFYGFADWKMIPLLLGATAVFYGTGLWLKSEMEKGHVKRASHITTLGVVLGIGVLLYFKYLNFFADSFAQLLHAVGLNVSWTTLHIVLPIGVSFFTFKLISYVIEIHREHIQPCRDFIEFGTYVAFFPTILSGPIDRPNKFIPQFRSGRMFNYGLAVDGCRQILWGMFTKMCVADNLAPLTDGVWNAMDDHSPSTLLLVALAYPIQMYADFDGYSNMAIGVGKILGFDIAKNFNHPFLARNIAEYWSKWHISLTSWITDYVFMPLNIAFRGLGNSGIILAVVINLVVIGLWHGANWTFALFGLYHGLLYIPLVLSGAFGKRSKLKPGVCGFPKVGDFLAMCLTFLFVAVGLVIFKAGSVGEAWHFLSRLANVSVFRLSTGYAELKSLLLTVHTMIFVIVLMAMEWLCRNKQYAMEVTKDSTWLKRKAVRWVLYVILICLTLMCKGVDTQFIYFQF